MPTDAAGNPAQVPKGTPLDLPSYVVPSAVVADQLSTKAEDALASADEASGYATRFVQLAVIFALVLFFASVATKFTKPRLQVILILLSMGLLLYGIVRLLLLPQLL